MNKVSWLKLMLFSPVTVLVLSVIMLCSVTTGCNKKIELNKSGPDQALENFTVYETEEGKKIWDLTAATARIYDKQHSILLTDFKVNFFKKKKISSVLTACSGKIDTRNNDFYTEGKTVIETSDGEILNCDDLKYSSVEKKVFTDSKVKLIRKDSIITGTGLEATPDLSVVIIKRNRVVVQKSESSF